VTARLINLDDHRRHVTEQMVCLFCRTEHTLRHIVDDRVKYWPCGENGCDEVASLPVWEWLYGR
jgi:hypothetical protein